MPMDINNFGFDPYVLYIANKSGWRIRSIEVSFEERGHGVSISAGNTLSKMKTIVGFKYSILRFTT